MNLSLSGFLFESGNESERQPFPAFCELAASAGYHGVELRQRTQVNPQTSKADRREMMGIVREHGLAVTCLTARNMPRSGSARDEFFGSYLELCMDMECGLMKIGSDAEWARQAAAKAADAGIVLATNNHIGGPCETVSGTRSYLEAVNHPNWGLLYDCMHLRSTGQDYIGAIPDLAPVTKNILIQSRRPWREGDEAAFPGNERSWTPVMPDDPDAQDWKAVFATFRKTGYDGLVTVIENGWPHKSRVQVAKQNARILRRIWEESVVN